MGTKMISKAELEYKGGYLVKGDDVIVIDPDIVNQACMIDSLKQANEFYKKNGGAGVPGADMEKFRAKSETPRPYLEANTPLMDKKVEESLGLMKELDSVSTANAANDMLRKVDELIQFALDDYVISIEGQPVKFDLPSLGNPLEFTAQEIIDIIEEAAGNEICPE